MRAINMTERKTPQPGEYWQHHGELKDDRVYFIGRTPDGEMVWQCEGDTIEAGNLDWSGWQHLPECTGWQWQPEVFPQYWTTIADESTFAYVVRCGPSECGDWFVVMKDGESGPNLEFFKWDSTGRTQLTKEEAEALVDKPAESPDDWVTQDRVPYRSELDECRWSCQHLWLRNQCLSENHRHGYKPYAASTRSLQVRCRRKNLPPLDVPVKRLVPVRLWCRYDRGNKTGHMYVFANTEPPVGAGIKYSEIHSDGVGGWVIEVIEVKP